MMEYDVLFRGKRVDNGQWVYGWYCKYAFGRWPIRVCIIPSEEAENGCVEHVQVDPDTVSPFTGLTDKNGVKIFKEDILHVVTPNTRGNYPVKFAYGQFHVGLNMPVAYIRYSCKVIGNIHDNPELLEVR